MMIIKTFVFDLKCSTTEYWIRIKRDAFDLFDKLALGSVRGIELREYLFYLRSLFVFSDPLFLSNLFFIHQS